MNKPLAPVDAGVVLPKSVRSQAARADAHYKKEEIVAATSTPAAPATPTPTDAVEPAAPAAPDSGAPSVPTAEATTSPVQPVEPPKPDPNWEHSYKSMKGRYDRSEQALAALRDRVGELEGKLASPQRAPAVTPSVAATRLVTDKEVEEYGPELIQLVGRKAQEELNPVLNAMRAELDDLKGQVRGTRTEVVRTARDRVFAGLDTQVPTWRALNENQDFLNWLALPDRFSGYIRQELLNKALEQHDAPRVAEFFKGFLTEEAAGSNGSAGLQPAPGLTPATPAPSKVPLETFVAPGRAKSPAATPAPAEKPIITRAQITQFYTDIAAGKYRGNEAEKDRLERMVFDAKADGRVL